MKPRGWGSLICSGALAAVLAAAWLTGVAQDVSTATAPHIAFKTFEYFPDYFSEQPPAADAPGGKASRGFIAVEPSEHRTRWFRARFQLGETPSDVLALYVAGANRGVRVFVNQVEIGNTSLSDAETFGWNYPLFFGVPSALLRKGENTLDLVLTLTSQGRGSFRGVELGAHDLLKPKYDRVLFWRVTGPQITTLIAVLLSAIALLVWLRRPNESVYGWFGLACGLAAIRNTHFFVTAPVNEWTYEIWASVPLHWMSVALMIFAFRLCGQAFPRIEKMALIVTLAWTVAILAINRSIVVDLSYLWLFVLSIGMLVYAGLQCFRAPRLERVFLLIALVVTMGFGALDFLLLVGLRDSDSRIYLMPYSTLFFSLAMGAVLVDAFAKARTQQERLTEELDARLAIRERQLEERHEQLLQLERERVTANERQRILRDIHDGLGSQLISSIQLVETGALKSSAVATVLRECVDDLRLAIDSLKPAGDDLLLVLGNFRYRMEPRLAHAGVRLEWHVGAQAQSPKLTSEQVLHTLRIVQEAFTNALKHARPGRVSVQYEHDGNGAWSLVVSDDGLGFQPDAVSKGDGLRNMRARASKAGVRLNIESADGGTKVRIEHPHPGPALN
jgi:signal transduction histidine kinase